MASYSVGDVLAWLKPLNGRLANGNDLGSLPQSSVRVDRPADLISSTERDIAFFFSKAYQADLMSAKAGIIVTGEPFVAPLQASGLPLWKSTAVIACTDPYMAMAHCLEKLAEGASSVSHFQEAASFVHPTAIVSPSAELGVGSQVGPYCVIEDHVKIGANSVLQAGCFIGQNVTVGQNVILFPGVKLYEKTVLGNRVRIHAGAVLGADGFGYVPQMVQGRPVGHRKIFHLGRVVVGDDVEIGANSCIDRGTLGDTRIDRNSKIDDLVMIGHNCWLEEGAIVCGKAGLAGRAHVGKYAMIGGAAGLSNDVHVGDGARVAAHCLVSKDVPSGMTVVGNQQREQTEHFRIQILLNRMLQKRGDKGSK